MSSFPVDGVRFCLAVQAEFKGNSSVESSLTGQMQRWAQGSATGPGGKGDGRLRVAGEM